ncbi:hypothetical protein N803_05875 [Knoellia subterranea KCTC 19937]|uniref:Ceramidase n=1 Tax=Knoellia subterranea KCTC 19937 TaxID=1385521 RepID=A0A0A0JL09_9MICO|nr:hypothetical protein N803_05875 [Knoellia subterranea KCTC 19937]
MAAAVSMALLGIALAQSWLGPAVDRGGAFCEAARDAVVRQPANTFSNLGFVIAGLAIAHRVTRHGSGGMPRSLATAYTILVVLLGPGSAAMHASESTFGGHLDLYSMYFLASFALAYAVSRLLTLGTSGFVALFGAGLGVCTVAEFQSVDVPVLMTMGNAVFASMLLAGLFVELVLRRRGTERLDLRWGVASVVTLAVAFAIWSMGKDGGALCDPESWLQPHAVWHAMDAGAAWFLYRYWASMSP